MIDTLPTRRAAIFNDTSTRKLSRSFYWGVGVAVLVHAGLVYYLVQQNFNFSTPQESEGPHIIGEVYTPPPPVKPQPQPRAQKPVSQVMVHTTVVPLDTKVDTTPLKAVEGPTVETKGPPAVIDTPQTPGGTADKAPPGPVFVTPRWKAFPDANTLSDYYPARALDNEVEGSASVQCTVLDSAGHVHCTVVSETPKGYGFGQQTAKMVEEKGRVDTSAGDIKVGSVLATTTVKWQLN